MLIEKLLNHATEANLRYEARLIQRFGIAKLEQSSQKGWVSITFNQGSTGREWLKLKLNKLNMKDTQDYALSKDGRLHLREGAFIRFFQNFQRDMMFKEQGGTLKYLFSEYCRAPQEINDYLIDFKEKLINEIHARIYEEGKEEVFKAENYPVCDKIDMHDKQQTRNLLSKALEISVLPNNVSESNPFLRVSMRDGLDLGSLNIFYLSKLRSFIHDYLKDQNKYFSKVEILNSLSLPGQGGAQYPQSRLDAMITPANIKKYLKSESPHQYDSVVFDSAETQLEKLCYELTGEKGGIKKSSSNFNFSADHTEVTVELMGHEKFYKPFTSALKDNYRINITPLKNTSFRRNCFKVSGKDAQKLIDLLFQDKIAEIRKGDYLQKNLQFLAMYNFHNEKLAAEQQNGKILPELPLDMVRLIAKEAISMS